MKSSVRIYIGQDVLDAILEGARRLYPRETVLLLRGRRDQSHIKITDLVVPPLAKYGRGFADIPLHMMPTDFSIVGTVHSHPSGDLTPSHTDLNHFFGAVLMIAAFPFIDERNVAIYNRNGDMLMFETIQT